MSAQKTKNQNSTRYYSNLQETKIVKLLGGQQTPNSGATDFIKGDVRIKEASMICECKTCVNEKESFSIKKEWLDKNEQEARITHFSNSMLAFNFGPDSKNYFIINEKLAKYLVDKIKEDLN